MVKYISSLLSSINRIRRVIEVVITGLTRNQVIPNGTEGSNPSLSAILTKRYRCVWRKVRRINRFRAFSGPDFFFQTIDANRCFRASAPIRTGRFPFSGRCVQPVPFLNGVFPAGSCIFLKKRITKIWASFCWS